MTPSFDPIHDLLNLKKHPLTSFFLPNSVALVGASERLGSVGRKILENLLQAGFKGQIYAVNHRQENVLGRPAYKSVLDLPETVDLVVVTTPAPSVYKIIQQCIEKRIPSAVVISAGFKELGAEGQKLENDIISLARGQIRLLGPNCLGLMNPLIGLNATFARSIAKTGQVAFLSQSGALCTAILDWSLKQSFGFSGFVSVGSMADIGWGDLIDYFGADEATRSIVIYMESIGNARAFLSAAREVSLNKPIIVIKAGRTLAAATAAASHTGSLTGSDEVLDAAFRRCGVLRVNEISEIFYMADILSKQDLPKGRRLAIVTNAGGPGVLATDALVLGGGELAEISEKTLNQLDQILPAAWSHANPIDILGDASAERFTQTLKCVLNESESDAVLVITTPQGMTEPQDIAEQLIRDAKESTKPILTSWMGGDHMLTGIETLNSGGIPNFPFPDEAVKAFNYMWQSKDNLKMLYETPIFAHDKESIIDQAQEQVSKLLFEIQSEKF